MSHPKAYNPQAGYKYQILCRHPEYNGREWEHCDYATDTADKKHLLENYKVAYGVQYQFKTIVLPKKYWLNALSNEWHKDPICESAFIQGDTDCPRCSVCLRKVSL